MSNRLILVVDDDISLCKLIAKTLRNGGYECALAYSGEAGLEVWRTQHPALIILDIAMPGITGWDVLRTIREEEADLSEQTQVVIMTAQARAFDVSQSFQQNIEGYLAKPVSAQDVLLQVSSLLPME